VPVIVEEAHKRGMRVERAEGMDERYRRSFATLVKLVGAIHRAGIPVEAGKGGTIYRSAELYQALGIAPQ